MTNTTTPTDAEPKAQLVPALPRVLLRMPDLAAPPKPPAAPLAVNDDVDQEPLVANAPSEKPAPPTHRVDAAHTPRGPHSPRRPVSERPAPGISAAATPPNRTSASYRKPLYEGAQGRRERMKATKAPVWRTRLFLAMIAGVLIWGTITISTGHRGKNNDPAPDSLELSPDIQLGQQSEAPDFAPAIGLDAEDPAEHIHMEKMEPAITASDEVAPPLQDGGGQTAPKFNPFPEPNGADEASAPRASLGGSVAGQANPRSTPPISSADLLGGATSPEYEVATRPGQPPTGTSSYGASMYGSGGGAMQTQYNNAAPANRSNSETPWYRQEPRGSAAGGSATGGNATGETSPAGRPIFDQGAQAPSVQPQTVHPTASLGRPEPVSPTTSGSRYGQQGLNSTDLFGPSPSVSDARYYAPGDPAADRPAQARLNGFEDPMGRLR
ncbi:hypothetical protein [Blastopirellula retiformator]|uniref:Uncharacterized protein n=1 Tax=Blastopirellula retiformator TaxID=2527970 RepID=A0A5C5V190_9BACT|nr:hypothetical protein [Blastopirellula retiformator]TWT31700.1 hypothetical protein Enr8_36240 [Blastopirellula retiformator]